MNFTNVNPVFLLSVTAIITLLLVQFFKTVLNSIILGKFDVKTLFSDGDFPSAHTSVAVSLNIASWYIIYLYYLNDPTVNMSIPLLIGSFFTIFACYIMHDAMGVRLNVQQQAYAIKQTGLKVKEILNSVKDLKLNFSENIQAIKKIAITSNEMSDALEKIKLMGNDINSKALEEEFDDLLSKINLKAGHLPHEVLGGICTGALIGPMVIFAVDKDLKLFLLTSTAFVLYITITILIFIKKRKKNEKEKHMKNND